MILHLCNDSDNSDGGRYRCNSSINSTSRRKKHTQKCKKDPNLMQIFKFYVLILIVLGFFQNHFSRVSPVKCSIFIRIPLFAAYIRPLFGTSSFFSMSCIHTLNISDTHFNMHILMWNAFFLGVVKIALEVRIQIFYNIRFHSRHTF